jgi:hypothetical protein
MREISPVARRDRSPAALIGQRPYPSQSIARARAAQTLLDTVTTDWLRLRTIVDALLRRTATSKDAAPAIAATRTSHSQEAHHG